MFKPASLTKEYLSGKRMSYLAPVRLYIFISFVTFLTLGLLKKDKSFSEYKDHKNKTEKDVNASFYSIKYNNDDNKGDKDTIFPEQQKIIDLKKSGLLPKKLGDSIEKIIVKSKKEEEKKDSRKFLTIGGYGSLKELDSVKKVNPKEINDLEYWACKKSFEINDKYPKEELMEKVGESFLHNLPKVLIIYMPIFAFILWLFHSKKKWFYFDHGIFTLHYFSFMLLILLVVGIIVKLLDLLPTNPIISFISNAIEFVGYAWLFYYFFPAHHRFYGGKRRGTLFLGGIIFIINSFLILFLLVGVFLYSFLTIN